MTRQVLKVKTKRTRQK